MRTYYSQINKSRKGILISVDKNATTQNQDTDSVLCGQVPASAGMR